MAVSSTSSSSPRDRESILYRSAGELACGIASGELSAREVVDAHIARIEEVDGRLNAVIFRRFDLARQEADAVDRARERGETLGPLAGVPITIKECFRLKGTPSTIGIGRYAGQLDEVDNPLVTRLHAAGAIVLGKTNLPQGMMMNETDGPVYGRANNPWNLARGPGGSSGGEGAIVAAGGSAIGLGNDVGGSIRQPAHSCGIHGLKPTTGRLSNVDTFVNLRGLEPIITQAGPLARHVDDLALAFSILAAPGLDRMDWQVPPVPPPGDPADVRVERLRVAYWNDDRFFAPSPALRRAVDEAAQALAAAGAEIVPFTPPDVPEAMRLYFALLTADGGADLARLLGRSRRDWRVRRLILIRFLPRAMRPPLGWLLRGIGQRHWSHMIRHSGPYSAHAFWQLTAARAAYVQRFMQSLAAQRIDCLLCPPHALPALTHGSTEHLATAGSYAMLMNLLGLPAGVVAATRVRPHEQSDRPASFDLAERAARQVEQDSAGLPVGVQVAAAHWREDIVLAVMRRLEAHFRQQNDYPARPPI